MDSGNSEPHGTAIAMSSLPWAERPRWLWPQWIPLGCLTLLAGEPGTGKSNLTLDLAARVSRGGPWPGECSDGQVAGVKLSGPGSVLLVSIEDSWHLTIRPLLIALGADLSKIHYLPICNQLPSDMRIESLQRDVYRLNDCRLIVIDPITSFLNELNGAGGSRIRSLVCLLSECVRYEATAMVLMTHLRAGKGKALHLPSGNDALVRAARSAWLLTNDPGDTERRLLLSIKHNLGPPPSGLAFTFEQLGDGQFARLRWEEEPVPMSADEFLRETSPQASHRDRKLLRAVAWLRELLRDGGQVPAGEVQRLARARGISYGTLRRAFCELGVKSLPPDKEHPRLWQLDGQAEPI